MTTTYEADASTTGPGWLRGRVGRLWRGALGSMLDWSFGIVKQAVKARFVALSPEDGLAHLGNERHIERYEADTLATYRARVQLAWALWQTAGTSVAILSALESAGFANVALYTVAGPAMPGEGVWPPDGDTANWSRFWILIDATTVPGNPFAWASVDWGELNWGAGWTWGSTATVDQVALVRRIVRVWKAAHEVVAGIYVDLPGGARLHWRGQ